MTIATHGKLRFCCTVDVVLGDLPDELRYIDITGAGVNAGCVVAVQAAGAFQCCLTFCQGWSDVRELQLQRVRFNRCVCQMFEWLDHAVTASFFVVVRSSGNAEAVPPFDRAVRRWALKLLVFGTKSVNEKDYSLMKNRTILFLMPEIP